MKNGHWFTYVYRNIFMGFLIDNFLLKKFQIILDNINFVKVQIITHKHQKLNSKLKVPYLESNYTLNIL
jgi:hypothetical protein